MADLISRLATWYRRRHDWQRRFEEMPIAPEWRFEPDDCFITSFPRSGNTWMRHLLKEVVVAAQGTLPSPENLEEIIPTVHLAPRFSTDARTWGAPVRLFKSHRMRGLEDHRVIYLFRDAADALVSYFHRRQKNAERRGAPEAISLERFCERALPEWCAHVASAVAQAKRNPASILLVSYEELLQSCASRLEEVCRFVGLAASPGVIEQAVSRCAFENLKAREVERKPIIGKKEFFRKGRVGGGREELPAELLGYIRKHAEPLYDRASRLAGEMR